MDTKMLINAARESYQIPGMAVAVVRNGRILLLDALGIRRVGFPEQITPADRFHLGSISKPMTATMLATLVQEGLLDWNTTLRNVFSEDEVYPSLHPVTLAQLLSHWGGIQPFTDDAELDPITKFEGTSFEKRQGFVQWILKREPFLPPGSDHLYSNAGYSIAAAMAERRTGNSWEDLMRSRLFEPLSMHSADFGWPAKHLTDQPWGHRERGGQPVPHDPYDNYQLENSFIGPAGDIHCNMEDLARFASLHLEGLRGKPGILSAETIQRLHAAPVSEYALGWNIYETNSQHQGSAETFFASLVVMPQENLAFALAANYAFSKTSEFAGAFLSTLKAAVKEKYPN
jgi:CubicO group peptidase (beta-lactamase class C family)